MSDPFAGARQIADAVLFEGYLLYPYRSSAGKNRLRWQFGVLAPRVFSEADGSEAWAMRTECVVDAKPEARIVARARFLQVQARVVEEAVPGGGFESVDLLEHGDAVWTTWDEAVLQEIDLPAATVQELAAEAGQVAVELPAWTEVEDVPGGRVVRTREPLEGRVVATAEPLDGPYGLWRLRTSLENLTSWSVPGVSRDEMARHAFVAAHLVLAVEGGRFLSSTDPPEFARPLIAALTNENAWPVLVGSTDDLVLAAPIILPDHPEVAPESQGDMCDATEIDEILALRVMTLTEDEKRQARGTDPRAAAIVDRCDNMPSEVFERLHGAIRSLRPVPEKVEEEPAKAPWWDPGADSTVDPATDIALIAGVEVVKGSAVLLRPGKGGDAQDLFLAGRQATVAGVFRDVDGGTHVAVTIDDDPAAELHDWYGRYFYFRPEEVEPL